MKFILAAILGCISIYKAKIQTHDMPHQQDELVYLIKKPKTEMGNAPLLVLLHGYGSNEQDLFSLFSDNMPENWIVISLRGTIAMQPNQFCWYNVQMKDGKIVINTSDEEKSRKAILNFLRQISDENRIDTQKIVLAGFSQGAVLAESIALTNPETIAGFGAFSGRFLDDIKPLIQQSAGLQNMKAFITHGTKDNMLPKSYATENRTALQTFGVTTTYFEDDIPHSISKLQLTAFEKWLRNF